ncbi:TonB-dependent receptor, partial [candidate division KSB1 bacterium]|nr:TonB-dependent receptor [candidate division KSB1 bacterium]
GQDQFHGKAEGHLANYITSHDNFIGLEATDINRNQDYRFEFEGPVWRNRIGFYTNLRLENNKNHLNGIRRFNVNDFSDYSEIPYNTQAGGDSAFVPLNDNKSTKFFGKLNFRLKNFKLYLSYTKNDGQWQNYNHTFKYVPDGKATSFNNSDMVALHLNHMFSPKAFYEFKVWYTKNKSGYYLYKDPSDPQYIHDMYLANSQYTGFYTGGQEKTYNKSTTQDWNTKIDLTWQVSLHHSLKSGFKFTQHRLENLNSYVRNKWYGTAYEFVRYEPHLTPSSTLSADYYEKEPLEMAAYFQDKMEFNEMVLKLGIRFDYLNPNTTYPSQRRNPDNKLLFDENTDRMSSYPEAEVKYQLSPRFGLTYQLAKTAMLHLSYGHFFQIPPFYALYQNADFLVGTTNYETRMGNGQLKPERTIQYEIGLWQEITEGMSLDMSLFYKDIYDLLTMNIFTTYNQIRYGLYSNKDYGNARGLEMKYEAVYGSFTGVVNYTLQYTRGVADNPTTTFTRAGNNQDPISRLIPLNWDQRHTVNIQLGYVKKEYGVTLVGNYGSGFPYTYEPIGENPLSQVNLYPNNNPKPSFLTFDLRAYYDIFLAREQKVRFTFVAYNLLDRLNELSVSPETGRANQSIILDTQLAGHRSDFNDYYDRINNPAAFSAPRMIKIGMGYYF